MKIKKNLLNIISIIMLLLLMIALIIVLSKVNSSQTLSVNNNNQTVKKTYNYEPPRTSNLCYVNFENNFGGTGSDEVLKVYNLSNYIIIGKTTSNNYYFENTLGCLTVSVVTYNGNFKSTVSANETSSFNFVDSLIFNNSIYILINNPNYVIYEYNILKNTLSLVYEGENNGIKLFATDELGLISKNNEKTFLTFLKSDVTITSNEKVDDIVCLVNNGNEILVMFNSNFNFKIFTLNKTEFKELKSFNNCNVIDYNINSLNYIFLIKTKNQTEFLILDKTLNVTFNTVTQNSTKSNIYNFGTVNNMLLLNNNQLKIVEFCTHGDELNSQIVCTNVESYISMQYNNNLIVVATLKSQINFYKISSNGEINLMESFLNIEGINFCSIEKVNTNLTLIGNATKINNIITNNFGESDMFIFEFAM